MNGALSDHCGLLQLGHHPIANKYVVQTLVFLILNIRDVIFESFSFDVGRSCIQQSRPY